MNDSGFTPRKYSSTQPLAANIKSNDAYNGRINCNEGAINAPPEVPERERLRVTAGNHVASCNKIRQPRM